MDLIPRGFGFDDFFDSFIPERRPEFKDMKCDIYEKDNEYHIEMDVPGVKKENVKIECEDGYLSIIASAEKSSEDNSKNYIRKERSYRTYQRKFYVGEIDTGKILASFENGVLHVTVPKEEKPNNKTTIEIQ